MPFFAVTHLRAARCPQCQTELAAAGARSFVVDDEGLPVFFDPDDPAAELTVELPCPNRHALELLVPNEVAAEEASAIPDGAPIAADAVLRIGRTESGAVL